MFLHMNRPRGKLLWQTRVKYSALRQSTDAEGVNKEKGGRLRQTEKLRALNAQAVVNNT